MRLIIDIPEEEYNSGTLVNYFGCYSEKLDEVIYNAPTVEMAEDCVSREAAVDVVHKYFEKYLKLNDDICLDGIRSLPSVQPQPKIGHWIKVTNGRGGHECDLCHEYAPSYQSGNEYLAKYCPNCGAKMVESEDEG